MTKTGLTSDGTQGVINETDQLEQLRDSRLKDNPAGPRAPSNLQPAKPKGHLRSSEEVQSDRQEEDPESTNLDSKEIAI